VSHSVDIVRRLWGGVPGARGEAAFCGLLRADFFSTDPVSTLGLTSLKRTGERRAPCNR
jgi:hypothetical protein